VVNIGVSEKAILEKMFTIVWGGKRQRSEKEEARQEKTKRSQ
jgi:hypothetical protein